MSLLVDVSSALLTAVIPSYVNFIAKLLRIVFRHLKKDVPPELAQFFEGPSVDERIKKIEEARAALAESLKVVDDLKLDAEQNKRDLQEALEQLSHTQTIKKAAEEELQSLRTVMEGDIQAFQRLAGVPDIKKERVIGFASGVIASLVAATIWWGGSELYSLYKNDLIALFQRVDGANAKPVNSQSDP